MHKRSRGSVILTTLLVTAFVAVAAPAEARWSQPRQLEQRGWTTLEARGASAPNGWSAVVWDSMRGLADGYALKIRFVRPDGTRTRVTRLVAGPQVTLASPHVALDRHGNAVVAWDQVDPTTLYDYWQSFTRRVSRTGTLGPVRRLSLRTGNGPVPAFAVAPNGTALFESGPFDSSYSGAVLTLHNRLVPGPRVRPGGYGVGVPVACPDGTFAGTFVYDDEVTVSRTYPDLHTTGRVASRGLAPPVVAAVATCDASSSVHLAISTNPVRSQPNGRNTLWARTWKRRGALTPLVRISPRHQDVYGVVVRSAGRGHSEVAWFSAGPEATWRAHVRRWSDSGGRGPVRDLGPIGVPPTPTTVGPPVPGLALNGTGRGVVSWGRPRADAPAHVDMVARQVRPDGSLGRLRLVGRRSAYGELVGLPSGRARLFYRTQGLVLRTGP